MPISTKTGDHHIDDLNDLSNEALMQLEHMLTREANRFKRMAGACFLVRSRREITTSASLDTTEK